MKKDKIRTDWITKTLLKFWPQMAMRRFAKNLDADHEILEYAHKAFHKAGRVDLVPLESGLRGFTLVMDRKIALYFYQDRDKFVYDGYEMGEYDKGDVTIFDNINQ